jgi:hypothetical protein
MPLKEQFEKICQVFFKGLIKAIMPIPRYSRLGESRSDYEYLREFEAKT